MRKAIDSETLLQTPGEILAKGECFGCNDSFQFTPARRHVALANIEGELTAIEMRCDHKRFNSAISELVEWHIPEAWGTCSIEFFGEPGTTFTILNMPDA